MFSIRVKGLNKSFGTLRNALERALNSILEYFVKSFIVAILFSSINVPAAFGADLALNCISTSGGESFVIAHFTQFGRAAGIKAGALFLSDYGIVAANGKAFFNEELKSYTYVVTSLASKAALLSGLQLTQQTTGGSCGRGGCNEPKINYTAVLKSPTETISYSCAQLSSSSSTAAESK